MIWFLKELINIKTFGRHTLYANYTEDNFLENTIEKQGEILIGILKDTNFQTLHEQNATETRYLIDFMYGDQDIKFKEKKTRTDINNTSVENWAYACVDWKKNFLLGKPVKYAPLDDVSNEEIIALNKYMTYEGKNTLDMDLWEDVLCCGRGYRYIDATPTSDEDEAPFGLINLDPWKTEVVYSSGVKKEQLFAYVQTRMVDYVEQYNEVKNANEFVEVPYNEYTVYTRNTQFVINDKLGAWKVTSTSPILQNEHRVIEYCLNKKRMGIVEIGMDIFNDINYVENLDLDDIEQFVNSIMVFTNAQVDKDGMKSIQEYGAVSIKSTEQKRASVEILQSRLKSLDTQIYYLRKLSALHSILSIPQATNDGTVNSDTGKGMLTGQGFTSASIRADGEELAFKKSDKQSLKVILKICKDSSDSVIKNLKISDIETKLIRDLSDNLLVKSQSLVTLASAGIPPEIRNQVVNLFSDPANVTKLQENLEKERQETQNKINDMKKNNINDKVNEQNNEVQDTLEVQNQEQE